MVTSLPSVHKVSHSIPTSQKFFDKIVLTEECKLKLYDNILLEPAFLNQRTWGTKKKEKKENKHTHTHTQKKPSMEIQCRKHSPLLPIPKPNASLLFSPHWDSTTHMSVLSSCFMKKRKHECFNRSFFSPTQNWQLLRHQQLSLPRRRYQEASHQNRKLGTSVLSNPERSPI